MKKNLVRALNGNADAQYTHGVMYYFGRRVKQDYSEALKWYQLSADHGYSLAQFSLGVMYDNGQGVIQDYKGSSWKKVGKRDGMMSM